MKQANFNFILAYFVKIGWVERQNRALQKTKNPTSNITKCQQSQLAAHVQQLKMINNV